jgi:Secreted and surface protein containing fasciclin-like repeats
MKKWIPIFVGLFSLFTSCVNELDKYYETPDWLKGNSWEVLQQNGNFKLFLSAVERTSYKDLVQGKGIITVMAPTDSAFQAYLTAHNYSSVNDIPASQLDKLVGYHLLFYSFNKEAFEDYKPNGVESENTYKGMYYKFRTKSRDSISVEYDATLGQRHKVIHFDRFLPVFSNNIFTGKGIDAKANYEFFYPNSNWTGTNGFNVSNASVKDYAIVSDNGYVYTLNKVLDPLETIYTNLKNDAGYSQFINAYDRFAQYQYDATATTDYGKGDSLFVKSYGATLPAIASEWPISSYLSLSILSYGAHNVFAPDNSAMQAFFNKYWAPYYSDILKVNFEPMLAFLQNHVWSGTILFPQQIETGLYKSTYGTTIQFDRSAAQKKSICVNGSIYGLNQVVVPPMFQKVTAPMYCDPKYNLILDMMKNSSFIPTLISNSTSFNVFYPSNSMLLSYTNLDGKAIYYINTNPLKYGAQEVQIDGDNGPTTMSVNQKKTLAGSHIATEKISSRTNEAVYRTLQSYNYIYTKGNKAYSSSLYNIGADAKVPTFTKIEGEWDNGNAYALSGETASALVPESNQFKSLSTTTCPADLKTFIAYMSAAGFTSATPPYNFLQGERFIALVPPAANLLAAYNALPSKTTDKVAAMFKPYFINVSASNLLDYPFPGANVQGQLVTFGKKADGTPATFTLVDRGSELVIIDAKGNEAKVLNYFPYIYADGAVYMIDKTLAVE